MWSPELTLFTWTLPVSPIPGQHIFLKLSVSCCQHHKHSFQ